MRTGWVLPGVIVAAAAFAVLRPPKPQPLPLEPERAGASQRADTPSELLPDEGDDMPSSSLAGEVLETLVAGSYTCMRLKTATGEVWAAVPKAQVQLHSQVAIAGAMEMRDFTSPSLKRTFERIYFGTLADGAQTAPGSAQLGPVDPSTPLPPGHPAVGAQNAGSCSGDANGAKSARSCSGDANGTELPAGHPPVPAAHGKVSALPPGHPPVGDSPDQPL